MFSNLIQELQKVRTEQDITPELAGELTAAAIASTMQSLYLQDDDIDEETAFEMTRTTLLRQLDGVLLSIIAGDDFEEFED